MARCGRGQEMVPLVCLLFWAAPLSGSQATRWCSLATSILRGPRRRSGVGPRSQCLVQSRHVLQSLKGPGRFLIGSRADQSRGGGGLARSDWSRGSHDDPSWLRPVPARLSASKPSRSRTCGT